MAPLWSLDVICEALLFTPLCELAKLWQLAQVLAKKLCIVLAQVSGVQLAPVVVPPPVEVDEVEPVDVEVDVEDATVDEVEEVPVDDVDAPCPPLVLLALIEPVVELALAVADVDVELVDATLPPVAPVVTTGVASQEPALG